MSTTTVQVHLPAYSHSFNVSIPSDSTIQDFKHAISKACMGEPQASGQRVIFRGRVLGDSEVVKDVWKAEELPHVCHLAVHPSAWKSSPPNSNPLPQPAQSNFNNLNNLFNQQRPPFLTGAELPPASISTLRQGVNPPAVPRTTYLYIQYMHTNALRVLAYQTILPWSEMYGSKENALAFAKQGIEASGRGWPTFLNNDFPAPTPEDVNEGVRYRSEYINNLPYLTLETPNATPTPLQAHAIKVLSYTFPLLCVPSTPQAQQPSNLLQVNPLAAPRPLAPFGGRPQAVFNQIPIRPLILPIVMLFIRTCLLLYFFQPARKPLMAILVSVWVLWELVAAVRVVFGEENERNNARGVGNNQAPQEGAVNAGAGAGNNDAAPGNGAPPQAGQQQGQGRGQGADNNNAVRAGFPNTQEAILNRLSQINIQEEAAFVEPEATPNPTTRPPLLFHKVKTFFILLVLTLHPAIWDRRRTTLRHRERRIRDDARTREARILQRQREREEQEENRRRGLEVSEEPETPLPPVAPKPFWVAEYVQRVRSGDWVDDS